MMCTTFRSRSPRTGRQLLAGLLPGLLLWLALPQARAQIVFGQVDTFQDGDVAGWSEGSISPNPPTNVPTGGPTGAGDAYLSNVASGGGGAGSRMVMYNLEQWTGDYLDAGVDRLTAQMANFGTSPLYLRVAVRGGTQPSIFGSTTAVQLPADGLWHPVTFDLTSSALTVIGGSDTLDQVLASVIELRIVSARDGPSYTGDAVVGSLGMDNLASRDVAGAVIQIKQITRTGGVPQISFTTLAGRTFRVERKNALTDATWAPLTNATAIPGTGGIVPVSDNEPGAGTLPSRFYRVVILPP